MKQLTENQIIENWDKLMKLIEDTFDGDRLKKLKTMYTYFEDRMSVAPASGKAHYHNAMVGGYVEHVLHVTNCALKIKKLWVEDGATINFTDEELIFTITVQPEHGTIVQATRAIGYYLYTPDSNYNGEGNFILTVKDLEEASDYTSFDLTIIAGFLVLSLHSIITFSL